MPTNNKRLTFPAKLEDTQQDFMSIEVYDPEVNQRGKAVDIDTASPIISIYTELPDNPFLLNYNIGYTDAEGSATGSFADTAFENIMNSVAGAEDIGGALSNIMGTLNEQVRKITPENIGSFLGREVLKGLQGAINVGGGAALNRLREISNPHLAVVFTGLNFRTFGLNFTLRPLNQQDARTALEISKILESVSLPSMRSSGLDARYSFPGFIKVKYYVNQNIEFNKLMNIQPSIIKSLSINYGGDTNRKISTFTDGYPTTITISMTIQEMFMYTRDNVIGASPNSDVSEMLEKRQKGLPESATNFLPDFNNSEVINSLVQSAGSRFNYKSNNGTPSFSDGN